MFDKDFKKGSGCFSEGELVSYLYQEVDEAECADLDQHLAGCSACTDEFASLSEPRFSVYRWQKTEFADLATPVISGPWEKAAIREVEPVESDAPSWIDSLLAGFKRPAFAFTAVPILIVISVTFSVYFKYLPNAKGDVATAKPKPAVQVPAELPDNSLTASVPRVEEKKGTETRLAASENIKAKSSTQDARVVKSSSPRQPVRAEVASVSTPGKPVSYRRAPRLSDFDEEEDNSVRLADLLAASDRDRAK